MESAGHALRVSRILSHSFARPIPAQVEPKVAPPSPCGAASLRPFSDRSVIDLHYCGGQVLPPKLVLPPELTVEPPLPPGVCAASCAFDELEQAAKVTAANRSNARQDWIRTLMVMSSSLYFHGFSRQHLR